MTVIATLNLVFAFTLELAMLAAFAVFGYRLVDHALLRWLVALALPSTMAVVWWLLLAPKAPHRLSMTPGILLSLALFLLAALALHRIGLPALAWAMAAAAVLHALLAWVMRQW